ncbi:hypothetical protein TIFTF001_050452, partial [Ficus carica]
MIQQNGKASWNRWPSKVKIFIKSVPPPQTVLLAVFLTSEEFMLEFERATALLLSSQVDLHTYIHAIARNMTCGQGTSSFHENMDYLGAMANPPCASASRRLLSYLLYKKKDHLQKQWKGRAFRNHGRTQKYKVDIASWHIYGHSEIDGTKCCPKDGSDELLAGAGDHDGAGKL